MGRPRDARLAVFNTSSTSGVTVNAVAYVLICLVVCGSVRDGVCGCSAELYIAVMVLRVVSRESEYQEKHKSGHNILFRLISKGKLHRGDLVRSSQYFIQRETASGKDSLQQ